MEKNTGVYFLLIVLSAVIIGTALLYFNTAEEEADQPVREVQTREKNRAMEVWKDRCDGGDEAFCELMKRSSRIR